MTTRLDFGPRTLRSLTRTEYLRWEWIAVDAFGRERQVVCGSERMPADVLRAEAEWDAYERAWRDEDPAP